MRKSQVVQQYLIKQNYIRSDVTCGDLIAIQREFYRKEFNFFKITELIVYDIIKHFYTDNGFVERFDSYIHINKKYKGALTYKGKIRKQELDIVIGKEDDVMIGISVKLGSENSNSYFDGADFVNPLFILDYVDKAIPDKERFEEAKKGIVKKYYIDPILQDMGRLNNLQATQKRRFDSLTIVFDSKRVKDEYWLEEFHKRFQHQHLFLADYWDHSFLQILEDKLTPLKKLRFR